MLVTGDNQQMLLGVTSSGSGIVPPIVWLSVGNSFLAEGIVVISAYRLILLDILFLGSCDEWNTRAPKNAVVVLASSIKLVLREQVSVLFF